MTHQKIMCAIFVAQWWMTLVLAAVYAYMLALLEWSLR